MINKKILILGANGMVGHQIYYYLRDKYEVIPVTRGKFEDSVVLGYENLNLLIDKLSEMSPNIIINAVGVTKTSDLASITEAIKINSLLPKLLENKFITTNTKVIHISTDCVFSGSRGNYTELDKTDGLTYYDKTKALGEIINFKDLTIRCSLIGPDINDKGAGLFNWFTNSKNEIKGYKNVFWSGVTSLELAKSINRIIEKDLVGLIHLVNNQKISKYDLLCLFNKHRLRPLVVNPIEVNPIA